MQEKTEKLMRPAPFFRRPGRGPGASLSDLTIPERNGGQNLYGPFASEPAAFP